MTLENRPKIAPVVFHYGTPFVLDSYVTKSVAYNTHRRRMDAVKSFERVLNKLEQLSKRLTKAARIDQKAPGDFRQAGRRALIKNTAVYRRLCVAYDLYHRVPYAQRFLNTLAQYNASIEPEHRTLGKRAARVVQDLLYKSDWRGRGNRPRGPHRRASNELTPTRKALSVRVQKIWRQYPDSEDALDRRTALQDALAELKITNIKLPSPQSLMTLRPSTVIDFVLSQHFNVGQAHTRPTLVELYYA